MGYEGEVGRCNVRAGSACADVSLSIIYTDTRRRRGLQSPDGEGRTGQQVIPRVTLSRMSRIRIIGASLQSRVECIILSLILFAEIS